MSSLHGFMYKYLKNMVLSLFGPESLKKMLPEVEQTACRMLQRWSIQENIELKEASASMIFDLTAKKLISYDQDSASHSLRENFVAFIHGLISFPLNIPGTAYHKSLQGRKNAMKMLKKLLNERRAKTEKRRSDFFDFILEELEKEGTILTEAISLDLMFVLLFASFETTSLAITLAVKFLSDNPSVLIKLREEHEAILRNREKTDSGLTWKEYKHMTYTFQGVEINGASKHFMAFGGGMRFCIGADFAKVQMAVFLHCLVTKYRWEPIKGGNILRAPGIQFPDGFHIRLIQKTNME